jgi:cell division protein ZapE
MPSTSADAARRFTWLVDVLYDERIKLIASAETQPERLFTEGEHGAEFQRSVSRLHEMQSAQYLQSERRRTGAEVQGIQADGSR